MIRFIDFKINIAAFINTVEFSGEQYKSIHNGQRFGSLPGGCFRNCVHYKRAHTSKVWTSCVQINHSRAIPLGELNALSTHMFIDGDHYAMAYKVMDSTSCSIGQRIDLGLITDLINTKLPGYCASYLQADGVRTSVTVFCSTPHTKMFHVLRYTQGEWLKHSEIARQKEYSTITIHATGMIVTSMYEKKIFFSIAFLYYDECVSYYCWLRPPEKVLAVTLVKPCNMCRGV